MRHVSDNSDREKQYTHFMTNNLFLEIYALYEILWKSTVELDRPQMAVWRIRIAC